jgi:DNA-binding IclR family transcriptional regulator
MTVNEAARFWGLDFATCERVLSELFQRGLVTRGPDDRYRYIV